MEWQSASGNPPVNSDLERPFVITGGAGFIGSNLADRLLANGATLVILDDLSRSRGDENLRWLEQRYPGRLRLEVGDVRDKTVVRRALQECAGVFHFAAQVAVPKSVQDPMHDFEVNVLGTLNILEELRQKKDRPFLVYTSTNKVYGTLPDVPIAEAGGRYQPMDQLTRARGVSETRRIELASPHACSKGAADQYVIDYARTFGVPATALRLSSVYGPRQHGTDAHGFVARFMWQALMNEPLSIYGDGKQVRDLLFVDDLVDAIILVLRDVPRVAGRAYNIGGGPKHTASLLEIIGAVEELLGRRPELRFFEWRPGDQRYYASDTRAFKLATGWEPQIGIQTGTARLYRWMLEVLGKSKEPTTTMKRAAP